MTMEPTVLSSNCGFKGRQGSAGESVHKPGLLPAVRVTQEDCRPSNLVAPSSSPHHLEKGFRWQSLLAGECRVSNNDMGRRQVHAKGKRGGSYDAASLSADQCVSSSGSRRFAQPCVV